MDIRYAKMIEWYLRRFDGDLRILDSLSSKQIESKKWLVEELSKVIVKFDYDFQCWLLGGWNGYPLVDYLINSQCGDYITQYMNVDMDTQSTTTYWKYLQVFGKVGESNPVTNTVQESISRHIGSYNTALVINCSSEHMESIPDMIDINSINKYNLFVLQSNDLFDEPDHCNCVNSEDELIEKNKLTNVYFKGSLKFDNYTRFMAIGSYNG
jgi:hypothetical protein